MSVSSSDERIESYSENNSRNSSSKKQIERKNIESYVEKIVCKADYNQNKSRILRSRKQFKSNFGSKIFKYHYKECHKKYITSKALREDINCIHQKKSFLNVILKIMAKVLY
jgi:hypothetical protein